MAKFGWLKPLGKVLLGIGKSGLLPVPGLPAAIQMVEEAIPDAPGTTKAAKAKAIFHILDDVAGTLDLMTPEQRAAYDTLETAANNSYVVFKDAEAQAHADQQALAAFLASFTQTP